jgi:hypothetical protein
MHPLGPINLSNLPVDAQRHFERILTHALLRPNGGAALLYLAGNFGGIEWHSCWLLVAGY